MSEPSKVIDVSAVLGVKVICNNVPAEELLDRPILVEAHFSPGASSGRHIHPMQEESYQVLSGTLDLFLDNRWHKLGPRQSISIPKGTVHAFRNSTNEITKTINIHDPGLRFQEYLEGMQKLIQQGKVTNRTGLKSGIYLSQLLGGTCAFPNTQWLSRGASGQKEDSHLPAFYRSQSLDQSVGVVYKAQDIKLDRPD